MRCTMMTSAADTPKPIPKDRLVLYWTIIGAIPLFAALGQPIVSGQPSSLPPEEPLAPNLEHFGGQQMRAEGTALFAGVLPTAEA